MVLGGIEITKREILFSTLIVALMVYFGVLISDSISQSAQEDYVEVATATQVKDADNFDYIRRTNVNNFLAEGELISNEEITHPNLSGKYASIEELYQEYTKHERIVTETYTDDKGKTQTRTKTEEYWTWDTMGRWSRESNSFTFLGKVFTPRSIRYGVDTYYECTIPAGYHKQYVYYTSPLIVHGVIKGGAENKSYINTVFHKGSSIDKMIKSAEFNAEYGTVGFWIVWIILTIGLVGGFYAIENKWLED